MDSIKEKTLKELRELADLRFKKISIELRENLIKNIPEIIQEFHVSMLRILKQYADLEEREMNNKLEWVYISYLRSGILIGDTPFQIDCYDYRNRISNVECSERCSFSYVWKVFIELNKELEAKLQYQTRAKGYDLEFIIFKLADNFFSLVKEFFPVILEKWLEKNNNIVAGKTVTFMIGEFMDRSEFILLWNKDHIEWKMTSCDLDDTWEETE